MRVLFIDDEEELVSTVVERLELRNIVAVGANNGHDALKKIAESEFQAILLDVRMPGLGGLEILRRVKETHPQIPVVLLSGHGSEEDVEEGLRLGAWDYLQKPVDIEKLVEIIRRAAGEKPGGG